MSAAIRLVRAWIAAFRPWRLDDAGPLGFLRDRRAPYEPKAGRWAD